MEFQASIARQCATRIERISVADAREPIYLIANQFGHRVITGDDLGRANEGVAQYGGV